jgi:D-glycero-D-manno-heptose 1,7-bisphosphate phosphatase
MKKIDVVILAGGYGTRIKKFTKNIIPKPLLKIKNRPFLDYLIQSISKYPINKIYIISGFKGELINKKYNNKLINLIKIHCIKEKISKGTGHALYSVRKKIKNDFILINGDTIIDFDLNIFFQKKLNNKYLGCMVLSKNYNNSLSKKLSNLKMQKNGSISFSKKKNLINAGTIFFRKKIIKFLNAKTLSLENDILHKLIFKKKIQGTLSNNFLIDIGTPKNYILAKKLIPKYFYRPALFLDRDGVINLDNGYTYKIKNFKFQKKIFKIIKKFQEKYYIFIVTNQSGIARGYYKVEDFYKLQNYIKNYLSKKKLFINDIEFCPHHPQGIIKKFSFRCKCRKPGSLMIKKITNRWFVNKKKSLFIGNSDSDRICAKKSNINYYSFNKNNLNLLN